MTLRRHSVEDRDRVSHQIQCLAVSVEAAGRELERRRQFFVRERAAMGLPVPECVPAGKRLVPWVAR